MSGVVSSIGKAFKSVVKVAKKVAPYVIAAAAIYFSFGTAAFAMPGFGAAGGAAAAGGATASFGSMAASAASSLGLSATAQSIIAGAATQAATGAIIGGATSALTGGNIGKGMLTGAAMGAVTGGVTGYMNVPTGAATTGATSTGAATGIGDATAGLAPPDMSSSAGYVQKMAGKGDWLAKVAPATPLPQDPTQGQGLLSSGLSGMTNTEKMMLGGQVLGGVAKGAGSYFTAKNEEEMLDKKLAEQRRTQEQLSASYRGVVAPNSLLYRA
ncbi:MAG: hypothetical protein HQL56_06925 [Magnetococcales bacterium]|nr:hypothetical protein [Magnetococcales bacterium]